MLTAIVFSKDRPLQLSLALQSIKQNLPWVNEIFVVMKATSLDYEKGYLRVQEFYGYCSDVLLWQECGNVYTATQEMIERSKNNYIIFFTDDDIVYRKPQTEFDLIDKIFEALPLSTFSLRLGRNTNLRDYGDGILQPDMIPPLSKVASAARENVYIWNKTVLPPGGYWSYAFSVDGHIYTKSLILQIVKEINSWVMGPSITKSKTPNNFESLLQRFFFETSPMMACLDQSCVVNSPNNRVQDEYKNRAGDKWGFSADELLKLFLDGRRLDLNKIKIGPVACPHTEINILEGLI